MHTREIYVSFPPEVSREDEWKNVISRLSVLFLHGGDRNTICSLVGKSFYCTAHSPGPVTPALWGRRQGAGITCCQASPKGVRYKVTE